MWAKLRARAEWIWAPALYIAVVLILYREVYLGWGGKLRWFGWDCIESYWPDQAYFANALRNGEWPLWNPYDRGGYGFFGDTVIGLFYPVTWLFAGLGALFGGMPAWTIQVKALLHHAVAGAMVHAFLRTRGLTRAASVFGGVTAIVSLPMIVHKASALAWPMVWAPLIWIATDRFVARAREPGWWRSAAALAAAIALAGFAGPPPGFFYILLPSAAYGAMRVGQALWDARRERGVGREALALGRGLALAGVTTAILLAVTFVPAAQVVAESPRAARTLAYSLSNPVPVGPGLRGVISPAAGLMHAYLGIALLALFATSLALRPRADRWVPVLFAGATLFAFVLSVGGATPVLPWLVKHVPGFGLFREANRYKVLAGLLAVVVAAHGLDALLRAELAERRRALITVGAAVLALAIAVLYLRSSFPRPAKPSKEYVGYWLSFTVLAGAALLGAAVVLSPARWKPLAAAALVALAWWDVATFGAESVKITELPPDDQEDRKLLAGLGDVERGFRTYDEFVMEQRPGSRLMIRDFRGYPSGDPFEDVRYQEVLRRARTSPQILEAYNVRWVLHGAHHRNGKMKNFVHAPPSRTAPAHFKMLDAKRFEALHPAPLVAWYGGVKLVNKKEEALPAVERAEDAAGVRRIAVVERPDVPAEIRADLEALGAVAEPPPSIAGRVVSYRGNRIVVEVETPGDGLVVLNEKMFRGWKPVVDGKAATPLRANYLLRAVVVKGAGVHRIEWTFAPRGYPLLLGGWAAAMAFLGVAGVTALRRKAA